MEAMEREALEVEFAQKRAELAEMMKQMEHMQASYARLTQARRARAVKEKENAAREETAAMERQLTRCQQAKSNLDAAIAADDQMRKSACEAACEKEKSAFELAQRRERDACRRYQDELRRQGFSSEAAYQAAFLTLPAQNKLEKEVEPFRTRYAQLLERLKEINAALEP